MMVIRPTIMLLLKCVDLQAQWGVFKARRCWDGRNASVDGPWPSPQLTDKQRVTW